MGRRFPEMLQVVTGGTVRTASNDPTASIFGRSMHDHGGRGPGGGEGAALPSTVDDAQIQQLFMAMALAAALEELTGQSGVGRNRGDHDVDLPGFVDYRSS